MKTSLVAIVITFAGIASGRQATTQPQTQPAAPAQTHAAAARRNRRTTAKKERDQRSGGVQRVRRSGATEGSHRENQRSGSFPGSISQQRDEGRRAGIADGLLPADQQPGQNDGHRASGFCQQIRTMCVPWHCWPTANVPRRSGRTQKTARGAGPASSDRMPKPDGSRMRISAKQKTQMGLF